jgi:hypothetical protein
MLLGAAPQLILKWLGRPHDISVPNLPLLGLRSLINQFTGELVGSLFLPMSILLLGLLFSIVVRKRWLAAMVVWLLAVIGMGLTTPNLVVFLCLALAVGVTVMVTMRYGLLTAYFCFLFLGVVGNNPTTTNFSAWYGAESTIFVLAVCIGLILYGFYTSLAGQKIFQGKLLNE